MRRAMVSMDLTSSLLRRPQSVAACRLGRAPRAVKVEEGHGGPNEGVEVRVPWLPGLGVEVGEGTGGGSSAGWGTAPMRGLREACPGDRQSRTSGAATKDV